MCPRKWWQLNGFRESILKVSRTPRPQICVCFHASAQVIVFQHFFFCLWIPLPRERKGLHCVREPHLSETFSSSAKTGGVPPNVGTPSGGRGFLLRSWWWGSGMLGTLFQNRILILRREAGGWVHSPRFRILFLRRLSRGSQSTWAPRSYTRR